MTFERSELDPDVAWFQRQRNLASEVSKDQHRVSFWPSPKTLKRLSVAEENYWAGAP